MTEKIIIAGSGGQGVLFSGKLIAHSAMQAGLNVTMIPAYGAEMRGGTANCSIIISDSPIKNPVIEKPDTFLCLNESSLKRFESIIPEKGMLFLNSSLIKTDFQKENLTLKKVPANDLAKESGDKRLVNMPFLGAYFKENPAISIDDVIKSLSNIISEHYKNLIENNKRGLMLGYNYEA